MLTKAQLIEHLKENTRVLKSEGIKKALEKIDRAQFINPDYILEAYEDYVLPIGYGQTISQPTTVVIMLELLDSQSGEKILDIGSGSGWTTALLGELVGFKGKIYGVEIIPELVEFGKENIKKFNLPNVEILQAEGLGLPKQGPFDRILVSASANELPEKLINQLKVGGIMVLPIKDSIWEITKISEDKIDKEEYPGFVFVPLV